MEWFHKETLFYKWWLPLAATDTRMWKYKNSIRLETSGSDKDKQTTGIRSLARLTAVGTHSSSLRHIVSVCHVIKIIRRAFLWENLGLSGNYVLERPLDWFAFWGGPYYGHTFGFPFCQRLWVLSKRRDDIVVADMVADMATWRPTKSFLKK